jgi:hypothetical protein
MSHKAMIILNAAKERNSWVYARDLAILGMSSDQFKRLRKEGVLEFSSDAAGYTIVRLA